MQQRWCLYVHAHLCAWLAAAAGHWLWAPPAGCRLPACPLHATPCPAGSCPALAATPAGRIVEFRRIGASVMQCMWYERSMWPVARWSHLDESQHLAACCAYVSQQTGCVGHSQHVVPAWPSLRRPPQPALLSEQVHRVGSATPRSSCSGSSSGACRGQLVQRGWACRSDCMRGTKRAPQRLQLGVAKCCRNAAAWAR